MGSGLITCEINGLYLVKMSERDRSYYLASVDLLEVDSLLVREIASILWAVSISVESAQDEIGKKRWVPQLYIGEIR